MRRKIVVVGDANVDWIVEIESVGDRIDSLWRESISCIAQSLGGAGAIFAKAAQKAGFDAHLLARVGADWSGAYLLEELERSGVSLHVTRDSTWDTGKVIVLRDGQDQKAMISHRGANTRLSLSDVPDGLMTETGVLYVSGYALLERPQSTVALELARRAAKQAIFVVVDVVPHRAVREQLPPDYVQCLSFASGVVIESGTARRLLGVPDTGRDAILSALRARFRFMVVSPDNETHWIADETRVVERPTGYGHKAEKTGFLDRRVAGILHDYVECNALS